MKNKTAFIIGGSGNIGLGVTKLFEKNNYKIIVLDKKNILKKHKNIFFENFELSNIPCIFVTPLTFHELILLIFFKV
jgi:NAD(P)-dependent dehydrogenase (short-subunit alcohol dehydrogenase family)